MATLTLSHGGFFDPDFGGTTYYVLGSGTSGNGTLSQPWLVDPGDTVRFQQANALGTGTVTNLSIYTNNNNIGISSTPIDLTVAAGAATTTTDSWNWRGNTYYTRRSAAANDTTPDQFTFTDTTGAFTNVFYQSNTITLSGMTPGVNVTATVTGVPSQSINGGAYFTSSSFTVQNGDTVRLRKKSSVNYSTTSNMTLTIGGISDTWSVTTRAAPDTTPDQFTFNDDLSGVTLSSTQTSNTITISGIDSAANVSVTGGTFSKNGGAYTSTATTCNNGDTFAVRHTASSSYSTDTSTTLTVDSVSDTFTTRTEPVPNDGTPDPFTFSDQVGVARSDTTVTSNSITITDINLTVNVSVSGGTYSKNFGGFTSSAGTAISGDNFRVRHTSSSGYNTATNTTLTVGGVSDTFTSTTETLPVSSTYGVEVYTSAGSPNVAFSTADNLATYFAGGEFTITNGNSLSASISVAGLTTSPLFHIFIVNADSGNLSGQENFGVITKSNGSFTFRRQDSQGNNFTAGDSNHYYTVVRTA